MGERIKLIMICIHTIINQGNLYSITADSFSPYIIQIGY